VRTAHTLRRDWRFHAGYCLLGDKLAAFVVVEAGKGKRIGKGRLKVISDDLDILLGLDPTYAC